MPHPVQKHYSIITIYWKRNNLDLFHSIYQQLSDLEGGATVFPNQGITVFPKRGSLLFWHNLNKNGQIAEESFHGACPTLYGIKWGKILHKFLINKYFSRFSPVKTGWRYARESLIHQNIVQIQVLLIFIYFPLGNSQIRRILSSYKYRALGYLTY